MAFTLSGTFKEVDTGNVRYFSRCILAQFVENKFQIRHDQLFVRATTTTESQSFGKSPEVEAQPTNSSSNGTTTLVYTILF